MAKRKRKKTGLKRGKGKKRATAIRKKAAKHAVRKVPAKKVAKRAPRKKVTVRKEPPARLAEVTEETVIDIIEEPLPGVTVVTELQAIRTTTPPEVEEGSNDAGQAGQ